MPGTGSLCDTGQAVSKRCDKEPVRWKPATMIKLCETKRNADSARQTRCDL